MTVSGNPSFSAKIGNHTYTGSDVGTITGKATFNTFSPYVCIGYSHAVYGPLTASVDAGMMYEGKAHLSLSASGPLSSNAAFQQDLAAENHNVRSYLNDAQFYPVLQISLTYRF